ncbi:MAG: biopolymer transporter ExbD [Verrucomicrobiae bacterium]|nr:biopolymer transporter ExbD [Verrucomicrobiae bacterium]
MASADDKNFDDINVTPMVDLYLVLLLIFIIMTTAGVQGIKVDLPKGSKAPAISGPKGKAITVNNEGNVFLDTVPVNLEQLEQKLAEHQANNPEFPVVVRGDRGTQYQKIMEVLDVLGRLNLTQIGLATQAPK